MRRHIEIRNQLSHTTKLIQATKIDLEYNPAPAKVGREDA